MELPKNSIEPISWYFSNIIPFLVLEFSILEGTDRLMDFFSALAQSKTQTVSSRIWTWIIDSNFFDESQLR